jgi:DoxX-like family
VGVAGLVVPMVPARGFIYVMKEWAYAGFAINLVSAITAHLCCEGLLDIDVDRA